MLRKRFSILVILALFQGIIFFLLHQRVSVAVGGYLSRGEGGTYLLAWQDDVGDLHYQSYRTLTEALNYAVGELKLKRGRSGREDMEIEYAWKESRKLGTTVFWKTQFSSNLNQMTFSSLQDASFFLKAFREGSYTASPAGHSILLLPARNL